MQQSAMEMPSFHTQEHPFLISQVSLYPTRLPIKIIYPLDLLTQQSFEDVLVSEEGIASAVMGIPLHQRR